MDHKIDRICFLLDKDVPANRIPELEATKSSPNSFPTILENTAFNTYPYRVDKFKNLNALKTVLKEIESIFSPYTFTSEHGEVSQSPYGLKCTFTDFFPGDEERKQGLKRYVESLLLDDRIEGFSFEGDFRKNPESIFVDDSDVGPITLTLFLNKEQKEAFQAQNPEVTHVYDKGDYEKRGIALAIRRNLEQSIHRSFEKQPAIKNLILDALQLRPLSIWAEDKKKSFEDAFKTLKEKGIVSDWKIVDTPNTQLTPRLFVQASFSPSYELTENWKEKFVAYLIEASNKQEDQEFRKRVSRWIEEAKSTEHFNFVESKEILNLA